MTGMSSEDRVEGWQMPRQPRLSAEDARWANQWTQVFQVPPLPTRQRYNRSSTARKHCLRAVAVSGIGVGRDQIRDQDGLRCPVVSQVGGDLSRRMGLLGTGLVPRDGGGRVENPVAALLR